MPVVTLNLGLGQTSKEHVLRCRPTERQEYSKTQSTHVLLQILASIGRHEPFRMIVIIFVTKNDVYNVQRISDRLLGYYPNWSV